jgi:aryl-alcohol dehydrogenase-like predicted oxidoreductase
MRNSLKRLQLDYVDIMFLHRPSLETPLEETIRTVQHMIDQGKAFYWGTSEFNAQEIMDCHRICDKYGFEHPICEQPEYNMLHRDIFEVEYGPLYDHFGMGTTIWSPLAGGLLTGKYNNGDLPEGSRYAAN